MPKIKPFSGIRPNPDYAGQVVLDIENLSLEEAKIIRRENPYSYVNMLVPKLDNLFLRGSKNELAFKKINENLDDFIDKGIFIQDTKPSIYVYQTALDENSHTGIWTTTHVDDYLNNCLRKHELTRPEREAVLIDYLQQTGIDANPVLITYTPEAEINQIIKKITDTSPCLSFIKDKHVHKLWKIDDGNDISAVVDAFGRIPAAYIADGHHRAAAAVQLALNQRKLPGNYTGSEEFNYFTSVYMASDQLRIYPFHRLVRDLNGYSADEFLSKLSSYFEIAPADYSIMPSKPHEFGMYLDGNWYRLRTLMTSDAEGVVSNLDLRRHQDYVISNLLDIQDPRTDPRLYFVGGIVSANDLMEQVVRHKCAVLFTLFPTSITELMEVGDMGEVMPPKSTWFEPKFQAGLLVHRIGVP